LEGTAEGQAHKSHAADFKLLHDAFGWGRYFGEPQASSESDKERMERFAKIRTESSFNSNLRDEFDRAIPKLVKYGGIVRNALLVSDELTQLLTDQHIQQVHDRAATIISDPVPSHCFICAIGERLDLATVIERTWNPSRGIKELSQKLLVSSS
jgi:hypothetical protein